MPPAEKKAAKKPAAKTPAAPKVEPVEEVAREVATEVQPADAVELAQNTLVESREYGEKLRKESIAGNRKKRDEQQKVQTLRPLT